MPIQNAKELFVRLLSDLRQSTERSTKVYQELGQLAANPDIKEALEARATITQQDLANLDQCFTLIGEKPVTGNSQLQETLVENFRKELGEIQNPAAKRLYVLIKAMHLTNLRVAEYMALVAASDLTGHYGVGVLLESCLADKLAFVERNRDIIRHQFESRVAERLAA
jgi:ferritin-like metal-binding protein YciE